MQFSQPEPLFRTPPVYPVFIPFAGCPNRCVFCAQDIQTGAQLKPAAQIVQEVEAHFEKNQLGRVVDLAFYGGTFTLLPRSEQAIFLGLASRLKKAGKVCKARCSTRPDAINPDQLAWLAEMGLDFIELGIQSFCDAPLLKSRRHYHGKAAFDACRMVLDSALELGVQLLPGMPGMREEHFIEDVRCCVELKPETVRLYPCMVLEGTILAEEWRLGKYSPWNLEAIMRLLPPKMLSLWSKGIRIIRIGLAPEKGLTENMLAGPYHPALGQCLRSRAIYLYLEDCLSPSPGALSGKFLYAPARMQGEFFGHKGDLKEKYAEWGLAPAQVRWWDKEIFEVMDNTD